MTGGLAILADSSRVTLPPTDEVFMILIVLAAIALMKSRIILTAILLTVALLFAGVASTADHVTRILNQARQNSATSIVHVDPAGQIDQIRPAGKDNAAPPAAIVTPSGENEV